MPPSPERPALRRAAVFLAALVPRLAVAYVTFGSVEAVHNFRNAFRLAQGQPLITPYLPGLELWIRAAAALALAAPLPLMFAHKLLPVVCDSLIAMLLVDAGDRTAGWKPAFAYALNPIPIIVAAVQPQWDAVFLYPLLLAVVLLRSRTASAERFSGAMIVLSTIVKPVAIILAPLLLIGADRRRVVRFTLGAVAAGVLYLAVLAATHSLPDLVDLLGIVQYAGGGVQVFGLPFRPQNRLLVVAPALVLLALLRFRNAIGRDEAVLLFFAVTTALCGLSLQYLMWLVPFAILTRRGIFLGIYTLVAGAFAALYFVLPAVNLFHVEDLGAFALIRPLARFSPVLPSASWRAVAQLLGNFAVPLVCLAFVILELVKMLRVRRQNAEWREATPAVRRLVMPVVCLAAAVVLLAAWAHYAPTPTGPAFVAAVERKIGDYGVVRYHGAWPTTPGSKVWIARGFVDPTSGNAVFNLGTLFVLWAAAAAVATLRLCKRDAIAP